jgi:hypothetical protein
MKKFNLLFTVLALISFMKLNGQINQDCDGGVGIGMDPGDHRLKVASGGTAIYGSLGIGGAAPYDGYFGFASWGEYKWNYIEGCLGIGGEPYTNYPLFVYGMARFGSNVGIGAAPNSSNKLYVNGKTYLNQSTGIGATPSASLATLRVGGATSIYTSGDIQINGVSVITSDGRYKKNVNRINNALEILTNIEGKTYEFKTHEELIDMYDKGIVKFHLDTIYNLNNADEPVNKIDTIGNSVISNDTTIENNIPIVQPAIPNFRRGKQYGLIAQDVKSVLPEAVKMDSLTSELGINYDAFIPILIEAVKAQQVLIESLQSEIEALKEQPGNDNKLKSSKPTNNITVMDESLENVLFQNSPNPFTEITRIQYYLTETIKNAMITIYDMNGTQLKSIDLQRKGDGSIEIYSGELKAGMYMYTLIADGKVIDTKQMILTN